MQHRPHPSGTPNRLKQTKRIYLHYLLMKLCCWCCTNRSQVLSIYLLFFLICWFLIQIASRATLVQHGKFRIELALQVCLSKDGGKKRKCVEVFVAREKSSCAVHEPFWEHFDEPLKVANDAHTDKIEPHATVHVYFGYRTVSTHIHTQTHICILGHTTRLSKHAGSAVITSLLYLAQTLSKEFALVQYFEVEFTLV